MSTYSTFLYPISDCLLLFRLYFYTFCFILHLLVSNYYYPCKHLTLPISNCFYVYISYIPTSYFPLLIACNVKTSRPNRNAFQKFPNTGHNLALPKARKLTTSLECRHTREACNSPSLIPATNDGVGRTSQTNLASLLVEPYCRCPAECAERLNLKAGTESEK